nr:transglycosylase domain-containing protein [Lachnospiraceae bacterium]
MNYSESRILQKQANLISVSRKIKNRIHVWFVLVGVVLVMAVILVASFCVVGIIRGLCDAAPAVSSLEMMPEGYATTIYDAEHNQTQTLIGSDANREYVELSYIPESVQQAFVAIEDARFYEHYGVDMKGILRAVYSGISTETGLRQGASTITQQLLKNQVFG